MPATYEPIATTTLGSAQASVTFSSIPSTYTDLVVVISGKVDSGSAQDSSVLVQFNSDTASNYSSTLLDGNGTSAGSARATGATAGYAGSISNLDSSNTIINIMNYGNTTTYKTFLSRGNNPAYRVRAFVSLWRSTSAINAIKVINDSVNFATGSTFTLYGIKAA